VTWSAAHAPGPEPPPFPSGGYLIPPTNAVAVLRGPLVYSLVLEEQVKQVRAWEPFGNLDIDITTSSTWNYAIDFSAPLKFSPLGAPSKHYDASCFVFFVFFFISSSNVQFLLLLLVLFLLVFLLAFVAVVLS
jgi:hypothetical protein